MAPERASNWPQVEAWRALKRKIGIRRTEPTYLGPADPREPPKVWISIMTRGPKGRFVREEIDIGNVHLMARDVLTSRLRRHGFTAAFVLAYVKLMKLAGYPELAQAIEDIDEREAERGGFFDDG